MVQTFQQLLKTWQGKRLDKEAAAALNVSVDTYRGWKQGLHVPVEYAVEELKRRMAANPE